MPLTQAQLAHEDEPLQSFLLPTSESFNDNSSDYMYKHIKLDLLSFPFGLRVGTECVFHFVQEHFYGVKFTSKKLRLIQFNPSSLACSMWSNFRQKPCVETKYGRLTQRDFSNVRAHCRVSRRSTSFLCREDCLCSTF